MIDIRVMFRVGRYMSGEVTAVFPDMPAPHGFLVCYAHIGEHSVCSIAWIRSSTRPATYAEYCDLLDELEGIYNDSQTRLVVALRK
jgi:hypothetical protein